MKNRFKAKIYVDENTLNIHLIFLFGVVWYQLDNVFLRYDSIYLVFGHPSIYGQY